MNGYATVILGLSLAASIALNGHLYRAAGVVEERERGKDAAIAELKAAPVWLDKIMVSHVTETLDINEFRKAVRAEFRTALRDPSFQAWAASLVPAPVAPGGGLLGKARAGGDQDSPASGADAANTAAVVGGDHKR